MDQLKKESVEALTDSVLQQAKLFLEDADEFYPLGSVIDRNQVLKPVSFYPGEEYPEAVEGLSKLQEAIKQGIAKGDYIGAAIGVDVYIRLDNPPAREKCEALELRIYQGGKCSVTYYTYFKKPKFAGIPVGITCNKPNLFIFINDQV